MNPSGGFFVARMMEAIRFINHSDPICAGANVNQAVISRTLVAALFFRPPDRLLLFLARACAAHHGMHDQESLEAQPTPPNAIQPGRAIRQDDKRDRPKRTGPSAGASRGRHSLGLPMPRGVGIYHCQRAAATIVPVTSR